LEVCTVTARDGITRVFIARRRPDLSVEEFQQHWRSEHAAITLGFPHVNRYVQNHAVVRDGALVLPSPGFDVFSELDFDSADAMDASWASPEYLVGEDDENNFIDPRWSTVLVGRRYRFGDAAAPPFRLVWLCASAAGDEPRGPLVDEPAAERIAERLLTGPASSVAAVVATDELLARYPPRNYAAILWLGFDDLSRLGVVLRSVLDVVVADLGRNEHDAVTVVEPNIVIGSEA
jgi:uncharacterized protein (TIGR02118 family)